MAIITNTTITTDVDPAISIDYASRLVENIDALREMLDIAAMKPIREGGTINMYGLTRTNTPAQVSEGDEIPLTKVQRKLIKSLTISLKKYRRLTTAEAIIRDGRENAINETDRKLISEARKEIKTAFMAAVQTGTATATAGATLQAQLANNWAAVRAGFDDIDASPVHFVHPTDVANYRGTAQISLQTAFGMNYVADFLGLGSLIITNAITAGKVWSTAKENLAGYYVPVDSEVAELFGLTVDESGLVGVCHGPALDRASINTLIMSGTVFAPELLDHVYQGTITPASSTPA